MRIKSVTLEDFKSFRSPQRFNLDRPPGLYFLTGQNLVDPDLAENGAGKSSILDGICWAFYGETLRKVRARNISAWGKERPNTRVSVEFSNDQRRKGIVLERTWSPNSLTVGGGDFSQEEVNAFLDMSPVAFRNSLVIGQFSKVFIDLSSSEKSSLVSSLMELDHWDRKSSLASSKAAQVRKDREAVRDDLQYLKGRMSSLKSRIESHHQNPLVQLHKDTQEDIQHHRELLSRYEDELRYLRGALGILRSEEDDIKYRRDLREARIDFLGRKAAEVEAELDREREAQKELEARIRVIDQERYCPTCGNDFQSKEAIRRRIQYQGTLRRTMDSKREFLEIKKNSLLAEIGEIEFEIMDLEYEVEHLRIDSVTRDISDLEARAERSSWAVEKGKSVIASLEGQMREHIDRLDDLESEYASMKEKVGSLEEEDSLLGSYEDALAFWVKGFKAVRMFEVNSVLSQMEMEANEALFNLGMPGWEIQYSANRTTGAGSVAPDFQTFITSPDTAEKVPWESWSGGESQRLRIASAMGFIDFVQSATGADWGLEFWDEPTTFLSSKGVDQLLTLLKERALRMKKQIWIIDHRSYDYGHFSGIVQVIKGPEGSIIEELK